MTSFSDVGLVLEVDAGTDQPFATDANRVTWASAFGIADWETFPTPARLQSLEYRDLSLVTISSTHWTSKLEIWIMITEGLGQPNDLANHLILGTSGLIVPRFSASTDSIRSERGLTRWPKQCVLVIHLEYLQIQHVSARTWSTGGLLSKIIPGSDLPRRKLPGVRPWCEFASSFRLRLEKGKPANQLPKWDVQTPEVAKSTEDDWVLVDHQPGPNEESANIGADGIVFLGAMLEEAEAEANKNHWGRRSRARP